MPINFLTAPGVALTSACFSDNHYEDGPAQKCFSNLLAIGFRRFVVDLYWDTSRLSWSLCPVELSSGGAVAPSSGARTASTSLTTTSQPTSAPATLTYGTLLSMTEDKRQASATTTLLDLYNDVHVGQARQADESLTTTTTGGSLLRLSSETTLTDNSPTPLPNSGGTLYQVGPYTCDSSLGLTNITNVFADYLKQTENSLNATMKYLVFNLHSAAGYDDPTGSSPIPDESLLPDTGNYIGELINSSLSSYIYTPIALKSERANLNTSWFTVGADYQPLTTYLDVDTTSNGDLYTDTGWPSESFVELQHALRFLTAFGTVDAQMQDYNFTADVDTIFPTSYITNPIDVTVSSTGEVTNGCIFQQNITSLSSVNSSWAVSSSTNEASDLDVALVTASNLTSCGISPVLNVTLGSTADDNISLYIDYIQGDIWSWANNEPMDTSSTANDFHCAALNILNGGKWQVADCSTRHYGACRKGDAPYIWTITGQSGSFSKMDSACEDNEFSVPRTALENTYLQGAVQAWAETDDDDDSSNLVWINLNDLDVTGCWVNGANSTCPYVQKTSDPTRRVVVPTVAAVIVFVLAIATIFIKCAGNRQNARKRTRRGDGGWDYEGVPS